MIKRMSASIILFNSSTPTEVSFGIQMYALYVQLRWQNLHANLLIQNFAGYLFKKSPETWASYICTAQVNMSFKTIASYFKCSPGIERKTRR